MIAHERIEGAELHPSQTELRSGVTNEATDVSSYERDSISVEVHSLGDGVAHVLPLSEVVAEPVRSPASGARIRRSGNDVRTLGLRHHPVMSGLDLHVAEERVHVVLCVGHILSIFCIRVQTQALVQQCAHAWSVEQVVLLSRVDGCVRLVQRTFAIAEVTGLVHVEPQSSEGNKVVVEGRELVLPELRALRAWQMVHVHCLTRPHLSYQRLVGVAALNIRIGCDSSAVAWVVVSIVSTDSRVQNRNELDSICIEGLSDEALHVRIAVRVDCEVRILVHVVDISPEPIQWELILIHLVVDIL